MTRRTRLLFLCVLALRFGLGQVAGEDKPKTNPSKSSMSRLIADMKDGDSEVRQKAAKALAELGPRTAGWLPGR